MSSIIENALRESPKDMDRLLAVVSELYYSGNIPRFWDVLAILAGADRGWGNDWFFTALEIQERFRLEGGDNNGR